VGQADANEGLIVVREELRDEAFSFAPEKESRPNPVRHDGCTRID
jgi:hypothetical protein